MKYIKGQALESFSLRFIEENASVNASCCEFFELLLSNYGENVSQQIGEFIINDLVINLHYFIRNRQIINQI